MILCRRRRRRRKYKVLTPKWEMGNRLYDVENDEMEEAVAISTAICAAAAIILNSIHIHHSSHMLMLLLLLRHK